MDDVSIIEKFFKTTLSALPEVAACVGVKIFNASSDKKAKLPYSIFNIVPLADSFGQAGSSIQTRLFVDVKFLCAETVTPEVRTAVHAVKEYFRQSKTFDFENRRISVRHERPLSYLEQGTNADERIYHRGGTFKVWASKI
jgi:hypothetical protein